MNHSQHTPAVGCADGRIAGLEKTSAFGVLVVALMMLVLAPEIAGAGDGSAYTMAWSNVDGGGGVSRGGTFMVIGTIGQESTWVSTGGGYLVAAGTWTGLPLVAVFGDGFESGDTSAWSFQTPAGIGTPDDRRKGERDAQ